MKDCRFHFERGRSAGEDPEGTWMDTLDGAEGDQPLAEGQDHCELEKYHDFNGITSPCGAHFVLRIDHILMKKPCRDAIVNGVRSRDFPRLPVDCGYRDSRNFWYHRAFLPTVLRGCVSWAEENGAKVITPAGMQVISDKRSTEKKTGKGRKKGRKLPLPALKNPFRRMN